MVTTSNHLHPLQVGNCGSNSRLVVDEDDNCKFRLERVDRLSRLHKYIFFHFLVSTINSLPEFEHVKLVKDKTRHQSCKFSKSLTSILSNLNNVYSLTQSYRFPLWKLPSLASIFYNVITMKSNAIKTPAMYQNKLQLLVIKIFELF